ncbi:unnamed protein product [Closterium sp. NIES-65]|nr:unnamed protein product [Closterium sp. NIES-65]
MTTVSAERLTVFDRFTHSQPTPHPRLSCRPPFAVPVKSANPLQDGLEKLTAGLRSNKYHYAGFQAKLRQHQMNRLRNDAKTFVKRQAAHKMALYIGLYTTIICVMRGRDSKGNKIGQDRAFGFYFILVYKRNDGDFDAHYGGFVKVREPGYPIAAVINTGYEGEDGPCGRAPLPFHPPPSPTPPLPPLPPLPRPPPLT